MATTWDPTLPQPVDEQPWDGWLLIIVCALLGLGVVMIFSASAVTALWRFDDPTFFLKRQLVHMVLGFACLYLGLRIDYRWYQRGVYPILASTVLLLILVIVLGYTAGGAQRWINLGFMRLQPAEWTKITMVIFLAYSLAKKGDKVKRFTVGYLPHLVICGFVIALLMKQPDFGTSVIVFVMMCSLLFVAGTKLSYMVITLLAASTAAVYAVMSSSYRMKRVLAFLDPWKDQSGIGYQITESLIAIGSGRLTGEGLGNGLGKLGFVPALETDFIGTAIAEELGFAGIGLVIILFLLLIWRGFHIALRARDLFGTYLAFGLTMLFGLQAAINLCVISGLAPTKGLTLPFVSYGGSSLLCSMYAVGILLNVSRRTDDAYERRRAAKEAQRREERWERKRQRILERRQKERLGP